MDLLISLRIHFSISCKDSLELNEDEAFSKESIDTNSGVFITKSNGFCMKNVASIVVSL